MAHSETSRSFLKRNKFKLQCFGFIAILVLPFALYFSAQSGQEAVVIMLLGLMAVVMAALAVVS